MKRLVVDSRITCAERIDPAKTVLVDAHSLATLAAQLTSDEMPSLNIADLHEDPGGPALANIIQAIVLYDSIVVDSLLFEVNSDVGTAVELFPGVIHGVFVRSSLRERVGEVVSRVSRMTFNRPPEFDVDLWNYWQRETSSEKPLMDEMAAVSPKLIPPEYSEDRETILYFDREKPLGSGVPNCCLNSMMTFGRAHFYLELARNLGIPLVADPARSEYFKVIIENTKAAFDSGVPEKVVARFENTVWGRGEFDNLIDYDAFIPPVAELVLRYAGEHRTSLRTAVIEIRESKNAKKFREWCAKFQSLRVKGRPGANEQRGMLREFDEVCSMWRKDVGEGVDHKVRKLKLADLPLIGKVLKAVGMDEVTIKDPILMSSQDRGYLFFLNDLLRAPRERPT